MKESLRVLKFVLFSISAGVIQILSFTVFNEVLHWSYWFCYLIALVLSVLWNFTLNRKFTFRSAANVARAMMLVFLYYLAFTPLSTWVEHILTETLWWNEYIATILNMVCNLVTEFLFQRYVVYGKSLDSAVAAQA